MKDKIDLMKELIITGNYQLSKDWILKNILNMTKKSLRKERIKRIFNE
jgi:anti-sigma28 factor (negative regulator of flagellin synthesis)